MAWPRSWVRLPQHDDRHALRVMVLHARSVAEGVQAQLTDILLHAVPHDLIGVVQETARVRRLGAQVAGDLPIHGDDGVELTGAAADAERRRLYAEDLCAAWTRLVDRDQAATWLRTATHHDLAEGAFSPDLRTAHQQIIERIDDAARERAAWLLDAEDPPAWRTAAGGLLTFVLGVAVGLALAWLNG